MVDVNPVQPDVAPDGAPEAAPTSKRGFFSTSTGKLVLAGIAGLVVLGLLAVVVAVFLSSQMQNSNKTVTVVAVTGSGGGSAATTGTGGTGATVPAAEPQQRPLSSSFTFRNIFAPTVKPPQVAASSEVASATVPADTLFLQSIATADGVNTATLIWNGTTYSAVAGDALGTTPWKVVAVNSDSVLMLYGDTQVTLMTGELLSK